MKAVILAGGFGTRLSEETGVKPKPMVEIGEKPILWHILKIFSAHGVNDFVICCGYRGEQIKEYFSNYHLQKADVTFDLANQDVSLHTNDCEPWRVTLVDTGADTMTGGRIKRVSEYLGGETFMLTYGDGVADIDIRGLVDFHRSHGKQATVTAVQPLGRFGAMGVTSEGNVSVFQEKPVGDGSWVNGGFFVLEPAVLDHLTADETIWEREPLEQIAARGELVAYRHQGFWQPMDTLRDKQYLEDEWESGQAPWKVWE